MVGILPSSPHFSTGLAIFQVIKAGFVFSGKAGSGLVISRLPDGSWSAPSCIGTAGIGWGLQIGADITDFVIVLNSEEAVRAFSMGGNVTVGGNISATAGPIGTGGAVQASLASPAPMFSYSKSKGLYPGNFPASSFVLRPIPLYDHAGRGLALLTLSSLCGCRILRTTHPAHIYASIIVINISILAHRLVYVGLFAGLSLEGTVLIERKDANKDFYGSPVPARDILGGRVPPPEVASRLYEIIEAAEVRFATLSFLFFIVLPVASFFQRETAVAHGKPKGD